MKIIPVFQKEFEAEAATTRKFLTLVPADKLDWQPHPKSMTMRQLATHIAEIPGWVTLAVDTDVLDFAAEPYVPAPVNTADDLLAIFEKEAASARKTLATVTEEQLDLPWEMRYGDKILGQMTKGETIRHAFSQTIHHRAQLGVFLRLLNIPIPGSYGPSADDSAGF